MLEPVDTESSALLAFLAGAHGLTSVERLNRLIDDSRPETSAEHSWHVALCALVLAPHVAPDVDLGHVLEMLAVHDLVEIEVGDVPIYDSAARAAVALKESAAAPVLFDRLPEGARLLRLWEEFEAAESDEARYARAVDRLQPLLLHWAGGGKVWRRNAISRGKVDALVRLATDFWEPVGRLAAAVVAQAGERGDFDHV